MGRIPEQFESAYYSKPFDRAREAYLQHLETHSIYDGTYETFNSGAFGNIGHPELSEGRLELNPMETVAAFAIREYLKTHEQVVMVDYGAMFALSLSVLSKVFSKQIHNTSLLLIATNYENVNIDELLVEARRRLSISHLHTTFKEYLPSDHEYIHDTRPLITAAEAAFIGKHKHAIKWLSGIEGNNLQSALKSHGIPGVHLMHEFWGGFNHEYFDNNSIKCAVDTLFSDGMVLTHEEDLERKTSILWERIWYFTAESSDESYVAYTRAGTPDLSSVTLYSLEGTKR
jgi:hypothetical protein